MQQFIRKEFKYYVRMRDWQALHDRVVAHMEHDPYCANLEQNRYAVRSIYYDTPHLLFYYEKIDGAKYRKKLRVRVYNQFQEGDPAFLEIKRKLDDTIHKDRAIIPFGEVHKLTNGAQIQLFDNGKSTIADSVVRDKFIYLVKRLQLSPKALITYEREAFRDPENEDLRVTFDYNVRSYFEPDVIDFYREGDLRTIADTQFILEVKFSRSIPLWLRQTLRDLGLRLQAISKYCNGLDRWDDLEPRLETA